MIMVYNDMEVYDVVDGNGIGPGVAMAAAVLNPQAVGIAAGAVAAYASMKIWNKLLRKAKKPSKTN